MKNLSMILLFVLLSTIAFGQASRVYVVDLGTMANSVNETGFVDLPKWTRVDSISVTFVGTGELDVDSLTIYRAANVKGKYIADVTVLGNFTVTLNLAAGSSDLEPLFASNATLLTGPALRGVNALKFLTRGAASGNDPTDPNNGWIIFHFWGIE